MKNIIAAYKVVSNKYLVATTILLVWILFFDRNDIFTQIERKKELVKLETSKAYYETEIAETKKALTDLQDNGLFLEKFARETYLMRKADEDIFIIEYDTSIKK